MLEREREAAKEEGRERRLSETPSQKKAFHRIFKEPSRRPTDRSGPGMLGLKRVA